MSHLRGTTMRGGQGYDNDNGHIPTPSESPVICLGAGGFLLINLISVVALPPYNLHRGRGIFINLIKLGSLPCPLTLCMGVVLKKLYFLNINNHYSPQDVRGLI
jgi:hypothetical protein